MPTKMRQGQGQGRGEGVDGGVSEWQLHLAVQPLKGGSSVWEGEGEGGGMCVPATLYTSLSMPSGCGYNRAGAGAVQDGGWGRVAACQVGVDQPQVFVYKF